MTFAQASAFVGGHHRHNRPPQGHKFSIGAAHGNELVGVTIVGRPIARHYDDGHTLEVTRVAVKSSARNACTLLYGAAWRAGRALGYQRMITYTRADESGTCLRAAGWEPIAVRSPHRGWSRPSRPRPYSEAEPVARTLWHAPGSVPFLHPTA
ncbi:XF1762 family protein [Nonomuraea polychroma]|uniref:XF1762 family protein n=1 Tax=Nonomuraea polychroma TaxID=46176 RepID=UPI003D8A7228